MSFLILSLHVSEPEHQLEPLDLMPEASAGHPCANSTVSAVCIRTVHGQALGRNTRLTKAHAL